MPAAGAAAGAPQTERAWGDTKSRHSAYAASAATASPVRPCTHTGAVASAKPRTQGAMAAQSPRTTLRYSSQAQVTPRARSATTVMAPPVTKALRAAAVS